MCDKLPPYLAVGLELSRQKRVLVLSEATVASHQNTRGLGNVNQCAGDQDHVEIPHGRDIEPDKQLDHEADDRVNEKGQGRHDHQGRAIVLCQRVKRILGHIRHFGQSADGLEEQNQEGTTQSDSSPGTERGGNLQSTVPSQKDEKGHRSLILQADFGKHNQRFGSDFDIIGATLSLICLSRRGTNRRDGRPKAMARPKPMLIALGGLRREQEK